MEKKLSYAFVSGIVAVVATGLSSWVINQNISLLFEFIVFSGVFFISLLISPNSDIEKE